MEKQREWDSIWGQPNGFADENRPKRPESKKTEPSVCVISEGKVADPAWRRPSGEGVENSPEEKDRPASRSSVWGTPNGFSGTTPMKPAPFKAVPVKEPPTVSRPVSDKLVWSNRHKKEVVTSAYFLAVNGNGSTKVFPVLNGQSIGSIWGTSSVPDIALSSAADRAQGRVVLERDRLWYHNDSARVSTFHNGVQAMDNRFELQRGDVIRLHDFLDKECQNDTLLILIDRYPEGMTWETFSFASRTGTSAKVKFLNAELESSQPVTFSLSKGGVFLDDTDTEIRLNNRPAKGARQLAQMDVVQLGDSFFICLGESILYPSNWKISSAPGRKTELAKGALEIHIKDRTVREGFSGHKKLLGDIRLSIAKGSLVLVLGGSGAGKTTFVNAVMGYEPANGQIRYDGIDVYKEYNKMKYAIGYVQQEDLLRKTDVVLNTLRDAARMHLTEDKNEQERAVMETLKLLGLEKEQKKLVGQLSGGQRKRLSIGVEYVGEPSLFFLDEPDSGLDGSNADNMWEIVRKIADTGKIVMVISHIPDRAFDRFDTVVVLAKDSTDCGRLAFTGSPENACAFFETERLEEIVRRVNRVSEGGEGRADEFIKRFEEQRRQPA